MNIDDLKKICTIIDAGSINKAAEQLYMSQPALSRVLKKAEEEYGITILDRTQGKKVILTEDGERFYKAAREITGIHDNFVLQTELNRKRNDRIVIFGTAVQQNIFLASDMFTWFYQNEPYYQLETRSGKTRDLHLAVINKEIDIAFISVTQFSPELYYEPVDRVHTFFYLSSASPLLSKIKNKENREIPVVRFADLKEERFIINKPGTASRSAFDRLVRKFGVSPAVIEEENMYQRMKLADKGVGSYLIVAADTRLPVINEDVSRYVMLDPEEDIEEYRYLVCRKGFENSEKYKTVKHCLEDVMKLRKS